MQGGDPTTKDPAARDRFGTGGLGMLEREPNDEKHVRGAISAVQRPNDPDSAGSQFFVVITDQPTLDGAYTVFARVVEGIQVAQAISEIPVDEAGLATERVEILSVTVRDTPPPEPTPFEDTPVETLSRMQATIQTDRGDIVVRFFPEVAPNHVRNFLSAQPGRRLHRHIVSSGRSQLRHPDRLSRDQGGAGHRAIDEVGRHARAGVQLPARINRESCRWRMATTRRVRARRFLS